MKAIFLTLLIFALTPGELVATNATDVQGLKQPKEKDPFSNVLKALKNIQDWDFIESRLNTLDDDENIQIVREYLDKHWIHYAKNIYSSFFSNESVFMEMKSTSCMRDMQRVLKGFLSGDGWALEMADASGKPSPSMRKFELSFVGDYGQCRDVEVPGDKETKSAGFDGNYCDVQFVVLRQFLMHWHLCWPDTCSEQDITMLTFQGVKQSEMLPFLIPFNTDCKTSRDDRDKIGATYVAIVSLSVTMLLVILGTGLDIVLHFLQDDCSNHIESTEEKSSLLNKQTHNIYIDTLRDVCLCFSVYTNGKLLFKPKESRDSIDCIFGLEVIYMFMVVQVHYFSQRLPFSDNYLHGISDIKDKWYMDISTYDIAIDGFFTIGGFLLAYTVTNDIIEQGWRNYNWWRFYFSRFWRISPPYFFTFFLVWGLARFIGYGAMWIDHHHLECADSWWTNILYINNIVHQKEMCLKHTWYIAADMQLFWISPLLLIPLTINLKIGVAWSSIVVLGGMIATGIITIVHDIPATLFAFDWDYLKKLYFMPYDHLGPYIFGILTGYFMSIRSEKLQMKKYVVAAGWTLALTVWLFILYGHRFDTESFLLGEHKGANTMINAFQRSANGAVTCWVIIACMSGYGGFFNTILSWQPMQFLGQLTLLIYLIHSPVIEIYFGNSEHNYQWNKYNHVFGITSVFAVSTVAACLLSLLTEIPMIALEKLFFGENKESKKSNFRTCVEEKISP